MTQIKDLPLSLKSDTFSSLSSDFDGMLRQLLQGMVDTGESAGTINIKVKVTLTEDSAPDFTVAGGQQTRSITKPKFDHEVSAVIQRKDKRTGSLSGDFELVRDGNGGYVMRHIDDGQCNLFEGGEGDGEVVDAEFTELPGGLKALPGAVPEEGGEDTGGAENAGEGAATRFEDTPFGWLTQFIGESLRVTEAMGNFTVRTESNRVILSSAASPDAEFYCSADVLKPHVGHKVNCVGYGGDEIVCVAIECEDCGETLYSIERPTDEETEAQGETSDAGPAGKEADGGEGGYEYDAPAGSTSGEAGQTE